MVPSLPQLVSSMYLWGEYDGGNLVVGNKRKTALLLLAEERDASMRVLIQSLFLSLVAGFYGGRIYKTIKGSHWKRTAALVRIHSVVYRRVIATSFTFSDCDVVPSHCIRRWLLPELFHLGQTLVGCCTILDYAGYTGHVVRHFIPISVSWLLLRLSQTSEFARR